MGKSAARPDSRADTGVARCDEQRRIRWASRRGMLELDLILGPFVERRYADLDERDRARYRALMACHDQQLWAWLLGRERPGDPELRQIVERVLDARRGALSDC